jgi:TM2 domain-containing membrane protein YozV
MEQHENKSLGIAYAWFWTLGWLGAHQYYLGNHSRGVLYSLTMGGCLFLWFGDMFSLSRQVREANQDLNLKNIAASSAMTARNTVR